MKSVLLVDDVPLFLEIEKAHLAREKNIQATLARSGQEALNLLRAVSPELVIMDLHMPGMDGAECCRRIREDPLFAHLPVVLVASEGEEDIRRCRAAGCSEILTQPLNRRILLETARRYLGLSDRRGGRRVKVRLLIRYGDDLRQKLQDYSVNMGTGGLFLQTSTILPLQAPVALEFLFPGAGGVITCKGRVAWTNSEPVRYKPDLPVGMGIQFLDLSPQDLKRIQEFVRIECADRPPASSSV